MKNKEFKKLEWKVNTKALFEEILTNHQVWIVEKPLQILHSKLLRIAQEANKKQDKEIMKLCCELALYSECDQYSKEYDKEKADVLEDVQRTVEKDARIIEKKFGAKAMQELNEICVDAQINIDMLADFVKYRIEVKKPLKTIRPLKQFAQELIAIETAGYSAKDAIEVMKNAEWQTVKLAWVKKTLSIKQGGAGLEQFGFGANETQRLLK